MFTFHEHLQKMNIQVTSEGIEPSSRSGGA